MQNAPAGRDPTPTPKPDAEPDLEPEIPLSGCDEVLTIAWERGMLSPAARRHRMQRPAPQDGSEGSRTRFVLLRPVLRTVEQSAMPALPSSADPSETSLRMLFLRDNAGYKLIETTFTDRELSLRGIRAKVSRIGAEGFTWRKGVMATAVFFLRWAAWGLRRKVDEEIAAPEFKGPRGSLAASLDTVLSGHLDWVKEVFGGQGNYYLLSNLVEVWNAGFRLIDTGPVDVKLNTKRLPAERIVIETESGVVIDPAMIDAIAESIEQQFRPNSTTTVPEPQQPLRVSNVPAYLRNVDFTGRTSSLSLLRKHLPHGQGGVVVISGLGGMGKTQLAAEYARQSEKAYTQVLWVRAATADVLAQEFAGLADVLLLDARDNPDQSARIDAVCRWLQRQEGWLLVLDSAPSKDVVSRYLPFVPRGHVIITSHHQEWDGEAVSVRLSPFTEAESVAFFRKRTPTMPRAAAVRLADMLGHLPLALEQAAAYLVETGCLPDTYLDLFRQRHEELWQHEHSRFRGGNTIATTWLLSLKEVERDSPDGADLMRLCAHLGAAAIPRTMLVAGRDYLPTRLRDVLGDPVRMNAAIRSLRQFSLMDATESSLTVHRLVQTVVRDTLEPGERNDWATHALRLANHSIPFQPDEEPPWAVSLTVLPHAMAALEFAAELRNVHPKDESPPKLFQAICCDLAGDYDEAVHHCRELRERMRSRDADCYATASVYLAKFLDHAGPDNRRREALDVLEELVQPAPGTAKNQYGAAAWRALYQQGILSRRLKENGKAERILKRVYKSAPTGRLRTSSRHQLGVIALERGDLEQAEAMFQDCLKEWADKPYEHRRIFELRRLAEVAERRGDLQRACELYRDAASLSSALGLKRYHAELFEQCLRLDGPEPSAASGKKVEPKKSRKRKSPAERKKKPQG